jgi:putative serine protease PepD
MTETTNPYQQPHYPGQDSAAQETQTLPRQGYYDPYSAAPQPTDEPPQPAEPRRSNRGVAMVAAVALAAGLIGGGAGAFIENRLDDGTAISSLTGTPVSGKAANAPAGTVSRVASAVLPSVVKISVSGAGQSGEGSGVVISSDGLILTNNHVIAAAAGGGQLGVSFQNGKTARAEIVGQDPSSDLAVIRAQNVDDLQAATLGRSGDLTVGEQVVAIGSPLGLSGTVTTGIVSALDRPVRTGGGEGPGGLDARSTVLSAIQTDAAINPGNSGGPLVNMSGQVVGINSAIATLGSGGQSGSIGLGFAIPIDTARPIADQLAKKGTADHAVLGVSTSDAEGTGDITGGALLQQVQPGGSAAKAGLLPGDVVVKFGDQTIDSSSALVAAVRAQQPGERVTLTYVRDGETRTTTVTLGSQRGQ